MKLKSLLNELEQSQRALQTKFVKWLKSQNIKYKKKVAGTGSEYLQIDFDNGTEWPEEVTIRFADHRSINYPVDIDVFNLKITTIDEVFAALYKYYHIVVKSNKYLGQDATHQYNKTNNDMEWIPIEIKRGEQ